MRGDLESTNTIKRDFKKELKELYSPSALKVTEVEVPEMNFLMIDGKGDPNHVPAYTHAVEALFALAYAIKFFLKKEASVEYGVMPLEGLWWAEHGRNSRREDWQWTMMIMQPVLITGEQFTRVLQQVKSQKTLPALDNIRMESLHEGKAIQIVHIGPFATEEQTLAHMEHYFATHEYAARGKHHEIYLSDPRRTAPEKMRTVLRHPFNSPDLVLRLSKSRKDMLHS